MRTLVHLSDLHFGRSDAALIPSLLATVAHYKPDVVVVSGDLTQRARSREFPHSTQFSGGARHCSAKTPGGEDLEIQEPILRGDCATFHFYPTLPGMLGSTLNGIRL